MLEIDLELVKNAVSLYCRLGFAKKKAPESDIDELHASWNRSPSLKRQYVFLCWNSHFTNCPQGLRCISN